MEMETKELIICFGITFLVMAQATLAILNEVFKWQIDPALLWLPLTLAIIGGTTFFIVWLIIVSITM